jgi:hypothetical protein
MEQARVIIEVVAGVLPGTPMPEFTKRWAITSAEWSAEGADQSLLLAEMNGRAQGYAQLLMLQPDRLNWVKTEWVWL